MVDSRVPANLNVMMKTLLTFSFLMSFVGTANAATTSVKLNITASSVVTPSPDPCLLSNYIAGSSASTQLGAGAFSIFETGNFCSQPGSVVASGQFILTLANGTKLFGRTDSTGTFNPDGSVTLQGLAHIYGGTGIYANAVGVLVLQGTATSSVSATMTGILHY